MPDQSNTVYVLTSAALAVDAWSEGATVLIVKPIVSLTTALAIWSLQTL